MKAYMENASARRGTMILLEDSLFAPKKLERCPFGAMSNLQSCPTDDNFFVVARVQSEPQSKGGYHRKKKVHELFG